jgi:prepilin-type N-terminal cleavage/methylation domain-containing protein
MQQQEKNNNKGFNILELLVVLAIVGVISAVAYPNFSSWNKERQVRQAVEKIQSVMKNAINLTERGTFAYVQVRFDNNPVDLTVEIKGMTMQRLASKINDGSDNWNTNTLSRCDVFNVFDYWDTDLPVGDPSILAPGETTEEISNAVYSITLEKVTTNFIAPNGEGAVCFSRNGKFYEGSESLAKDSSSIPYEFIYICRRTSDVEFCDVDYDDSDVPADVIPTSEVEYLRRVHWGRFGNFSVSKFKNIYSIDPVTKVKTYNGGEWIY